MIVLDDHDAYNSHQESGRMIRLHGKVNNFVMRMTIIPPAKRGNDMKSDTQVLGVLGFTRQEDDLGRRSQTPYARTREVTTCARQGKLMLTAAHDGATRDRRWTTSA